MSDDIQAQQPKTLEQELRTALRQINSQIEEIRQVAVRESFPPVKMTDSHGNYIWAPLVVAKAHVLHALTLLEVQK